VAGSNLQTESHGAEAFAFGQRFLGFVLAAGFLQGGAEVFAKVRVVGREFGGAGVFFVGLPILSNAMSR
jgi:hypothetical protein